MRYLISSKKNKWTKKFSERLEKPHEIFQDVKVVAYPVAYTDNDVLDLSNSGVYSKPKILGLSRIIDGDLKRALLFSRRKIYY